MNRLYYLQHVPFEGPGCIADWVQKHGGSLTAIRMYADDPMPALDSVDGLIVMGGPMGVHDTDRYPWLTAEKRFIEQALARKTPMLGICLGAQLLANVMGARVYPNAHREIGWFPVVFDTVPSGLSGIPERLDAFHWHGDTFELPMGAERFGKTAGCANQGFVAGPAIVALQFHLEVTPDGARSLIENCGDELASGGPYVQSEDTLLADAALFKAANRTMGGILDQMSFSATAE